MKTEYYNNTIWMTQRRGLGLQRLALTKKKTEFKLCDTGERWRVMESYCYLIKLVHRGGAAILKVWGFKGET